MRNLYNKILVYHQAAIGDMVMAIPAMQAIRANFPNSQIDLLAVSSVEGSIQRSLIEPLKIFNNTVFIEHFGSPIKRLIPKIKIINRMLFGNYNTVFMLVVDPKWYEYMFFQLSKIKNIVSLADWSFDKANRRYSDIFLDKLEFHGIQTKLFRGLPNLSFSEDEIEKGNKIFNSLNIPPNTIPIACCITAAKRVKFYPLEKYREILNELKRKYNIYPVFLCSKNEVRFVNSFIDSLKDTCGGEILSSDDNLRELLCALRNFKFYLGNDTGAVHLAALAGLRCIGLYTSRQTGIPFYPLGENHIILQKVMDCSGCRKDKCPYNKIPLCLEKINIESVLAAVNDILEKNTF